MNSPDLYQTDMSVGEVLRRTRVHYGQSLIDIERALHIRASQIEAIETGHIEKLPGRVYAIGFVRSYSEYLGLDGNKMVHLFKVQSGAASRPELDFPVPASESRIPSMWIVMASLAVAVLLVAGWWMLQSRDRTVVTEIAAVPKEVAAAEIMGPPAPSPVAEPAKPKGIILNMLENSWVEIKDKDGKSIVSRVLKGGDQYFVPDSPDLTMSLGNAGAVKVEINGVEMAPLGKPGEVRRNIVLDAASLQTTKTIEPEAQSGDKSKN